MDEFGKRLWRAITRWAGETGETSPLEAVARMTNLTTRTARDRFHNHMSWSLWELKQIRDAVGDEVRSLVSEYIGQDQESCKRK